jgi:hypothetical protein
MHGRLFSGCGAAKKKLADDRFGIPSKLHARIIPRSRFVARQLSG